MPEGLARKRSVSVTSRTIRVLSAAFILLAASGMIRIPAAQAATSPCKTSTVASWDLGIGFAGPQAEKLKVVDRVVDNTNWKQVRGSGIGVYIAWTDASGNYGGTFVDPAPGHYIFGKGVQIQRVYICG